MTGRVAIVTGGSLGLGRAIARELIGRDYKVAIFARGQASLDAAAEELGDVLAVSVDVTSETSIGRGFATVDERLGPVGTLINNAAIYRPFDIDNATAGRVEPLVQTNLCGPIYCMREAVGRMRALGGGDIVNISSESTRRATPFFTVYTATKAALEAMTTMMGEELRSDGIRTMIFRVGRMDSDGARSMTVPDNILPRFLEAVEKSGAGHWTGPGMATSTAARALVDALQTARDARLELLELRSA